jgi:diaminohydroxyphosphoribosylaminopyrimidine deaminase / 5-amino-6-(5-phosphoribosylamino)uracil reductase
MLAHQLYMRRCLQLAALGAGRVRPNPMVGAVLVYGERIIGEGFHQQYGEAHAEVNCINSVLPADQHLIKDSVLYVSLEPCVHHGKTPPCADLIIARQIKTVVLGCRDPFEAVNGRGVEKLSAAGVELVTGVLDAECMLMNKRFFCFHQQQRPYIILKWAETANHCIAHKDKTPAKISGDLSDRLVHRWRTEEAAILVGTQTALTDQPALTARLWPGPQPMRLLIDKELMVPVSSPLFADEGRLIVFNYKRSAIEKNILYVQLKAAEPVLPQLLRKLHDLQIQSLIIEGGTILLQSFIDENLWDEARVITNTNMVINDGYAAPKLTTGRVATREQIEADCITCFTK